jgi:hypothetical protein
MSRWKKITGPIARMPRGAIITVALGLVISIAVFGLRFVDLGLSAEVEWAVSEQVETPASVDVPGGGSLELARTSIASTAPTTRDDLLFRVSGVVIASSSKGPLRVRCDVGATEAGTTIARTPKKRAAWPRPSDDLSLQDVPELIVLSFRTDGAETVGLEIRDSIRRYTDSAAFATVDWDGFDEATQNWVWEFPKGTGGVPATLGYAVVFKSTARPEAVIECSASVAGGRSAGTEAGAVQELWPMPVEEEDAA